MDTVRYYIALVLLVMGPPQLLPWPLIHPFIRFWRQLAPAFAYGVMGMVMGLSGLGLFLARKSLLATDFGTNYLLAALGVLLNAAAIWLSLLWRQRLAFSILAGLPELAPQQYPTGLITEGIYGRIRHPRYVQIILSVWGLALIANYLSGYAVGVLWVVGVLLITPLEEKELRDRYGAAYEEYCRRVPRFLPRFFKQ